MNKTDLIAEAERCVACGLCLPYCPTYRLTQSEADSPRGRIQMVSAVAQGKLAPSPRFVEHIDRCLSCRSCERVCPNGVKYGVVADGARELIAQLVPRSRTTRWLQRVVMDVLGNRMMIKALGWMLLLAQRSGITQLAQRFPALEKLNALLPAVPAPEHWRDCYPAEKQRGEVCLFLGCVSDMIDTDTLRAAIFVLNHLGYTVHVPPQQTCCGALHRGMGNEAHADALVARNASAFSPYADFPLLSIASGCGASLHDYLQGHLQQPVQDISTFLAQAAGWDDCEIAPLNETILVQDPCTLRNVLRQPQPVYDVLQRIPAVRVVPLAGNAQCCGGAGAYMLTQPTMAGQLRDDKIAACRREMQAREFQSGELQSKVRRAWLATSNIGCALHIAAGLRDTEMEIRVAHPVAILARQMGFNRCF